MEIMSSKKSEGHSELQYPFTTHRRVLIRWRTDENEMEQTNKEM